MNLEKSIGNTPLVELARINPNPVNRVLVKLEGNNPAGSVKDRPAYSMIAGGEARGVFQPGDTLIEATSGNTGIALAMVAAMRGYRMILIMPENATEERKQGMRAYGAELILVSKEQGMEGARDLALEMQSEGKGRVLNQFANPDNWKAHYTGTGPEIWRDTGGRITHFVSAMGTTGTITGCGRFFRDKAASTGGVKVEVIGLQPLDDANIPGIRRWPKAYLPDIYDAGVVDRIFDAGEEEAIATMREMARKEGVFAGVSSGANVHAALELSRKLSGATIVAIVCDRGDRYLSSNVFA